MMKDCFVRSGVAKLHYLSSGDADGLAPLVYLPGFGSDAESFRPEMKRLYPRRVVGVGKRGLGKSSVTKSGYSFDMQVSDLDAVINASGLEPICLMAFSMGVPVALGYALQNLAKLKGLILLDYRAQYPKLPKDWADKTLQDSGLVPHYVAGMQLESQEIRLWSDLPKITCPVLIVRGGKSGALSAEEGERYVSLLPCARQVVFEDSGHEVYKPDYERFVTTIGAFLSSLD